MTIRDRYHRQRLLPAIGDSGQQRLSEATVLIVGAGALGSVSADALCRAGVGTIRLVDRDVVEETNLQRQSLYTQRDIGYPKAEAASTRLRDTNRDTTIEAHAAHLGAHNALELIEGAHAVVDGTDNFSTRYLLNDVCVKRRVPYVYAGAVGTSGTGAVIIPGTTGCLRCLLPDPPPGAQVDTCDSAGVLGPLVWMVACWQATETIKLLVGDTGAVSRGVRRFEAWSSDIAVRSLTDALARDPECPCCAHNRYEFLEGEETRTTTLCGRGAVQITPARPQVWDAETLGARLRALGEVERAGSSVRAEIDGYELTVFPDGRAIVRGADDEDHARALYDRYVGS
ncbi:MAG: thiazole biosynthesis adenylyltransferase ThiF [Phycisphaerales bacterium]